MKKTHNILQEMIQGNFDEFAKRLGLSASMVYKYCEPTQDYTHSGTTNPLDRLEMITEAAISLNPSKHLLAIKWLCERFGLIVVPKPKNVINDLDLTSQLLQTITEFGKLTESTSKALNDGKITNEESEEISKRAWELVSQVFSFATKIKRAAVDE